jgi:hypothetical protein
MTNVKWFGAAVSARCLLLATLLLAICAVPGQASAARSGGPSSAPALAEAGNGCPQRLASRYGIVPKPIGSDQGWTIDINGVAAPAANDVWIGGDVQATHVLSGTTVFSGYVSVIEHWDGRRWCVADSPLIAYSILRSLTASGPADVWAVGEGGQARPLIEHWDGRRWTVTPTQAIPGANFYNLSSVAASSPSNAWAVGDALTPGLRNRDYQVVEHWDGHAWRLVPTGIAPRLQGYQQLNAVTTRATNDTWVVGLDTSSIQSRQVPLAMHWDGVHWQHAPLPPQADAQRLERLDAVAALSARDVWAVGTFNASGTGGGGGPGPLAFHWDGARWRAVPVPNDPDAAHSEGLQGWELHAIAAISPVDIWAMGPPSHAAHWNGHVWRAFALTGPSLSEPAISAVSAESTRDVWAVGLGTVLADHWDGHRWTAVSTAPAG